jgi:uncharacterized membrane protein
MTRAQNGWDDERIEGIIGNLLRSGVIAAAALVLAGGIVYLARHGSERPDYATFRGEPAWLTSLGGIVSAAVHLRGRGIIQLGLLVLIATPIARVAFSIFAFLEQRDLLYVGITLVVFGMLLYSLGAGHV